MSFIKDVVRNALLKYFSHLWCELVPRLKSITLKPAKLGNNRVHCFAVYLNVPAVTRSVVYAKLPGNIGDEDHQCHRLPGKYINMLSVILNQHLIN